MERKVRFEDASSLVASGPSLGKAFKPLSTRGFGSRGTKEPLWALPKPSRSPCRGRPQKTGFSGSRASSRHQTTKRPFSP